MASPTLSDLRRALYTSGLGHGAWRMTAPYLWAVAEEAGLPVDDMRRVERYLLPLVCQGDDTLPLPDPARWPCTVRVHCAALPETQLRRVSHFPLDVIPTTAGGLPRVLAPQAEDPVVQGIRALGPLVQTHEGTSAPIVEVPCVVELRRMAAGEYRARPRYPAALLRYLAALSRAHDAWQAQSAAFRVEAMLAAPLATPGAVLHAAVITTRFVQLGDTMLDTLSLTGRIADELRPVHDRVVADLRATHGTPRDATSDHSSPLFLDETLALDAWQTPGGAFGVRMGMETGDDTVRVSVMLVAAPHRSD